MKDHKHEDIEKYLDIKVIINDSMDVCVRIQGTNQFFSDSINYGDNKRT